jgi:hypothetical protein
MHENSRSANGEETTMAEYAAHWWKEAEEGPYNCCVLLPHVAWSSVTFRSDTWRGLRKSMRELGVDPGKMREGDVAMTELDGIHQSLRQGRRLVGAP